MTIIFIGPLPPPVHGMAAMNQSVCKRLTDEAMNLKIINTAAKSLRRDIIYRLSKLPGVVIGWLQLLTHLIQNRSPVVYIAFAGGLGQIYDLMMVILSRIFGARIVFHHHTFAFLIKKKKLSEIIFYIAGKQTSHIVLCDAMALQLQKKYGAQKISVVSNVASMPAFKGVARQKILTIGFIGNITIEKGGEIYLDLAKKILQEHLSFEVMLAGPCPEPLLAKDIAQANMKGILKWIGPVYNQKKEDFFKKIDVLIMPTMYPNEAEPLVIWEALSAGIPVIAFNRGCIAGQLKNDAGIALSKNTDFVKNTIKILKKWKENPQIYSQFSQSAINRYQEALHLRNVEWDSLISVLNRKTA